MHAMANPEVSITFRTSAQVRDQLDEIARNMERDRTYVINEAIGEFLQWMDYEQKRSAAARAAIESGGVHELAEVLDEFDREFFPGELEGQEAQLARQAERRG